MSNRSFAVFDIDGTLIRWQLYHAVVNELAKRNLLGSQAYEDIRAARLAWKVRTHPEAFKDYERKVVELFDEAVANIPVNEFQKAVDAVINEYKDQVYTYTRDLIRDLKNRGFVLLAISGSQQELVKALAEHYAFDDSVGSLYEQKDGKFTGEKVAASEGKAKLLDRLVKIHHLTYHGSYAVGDSMSDAPMLEKVTHPIAFNPDRKLYQTAKNNGWKIVIERKNVIYELENADGKYLLA